jgi:quinol monooxygenase YgiN
MRTFVIAMLALGTLTLRADAQAAKSAVGSEQVYWMLTVSVDKMDEFKSLVGKLVAATEKEPGALQYEYNVGDDHKTVDIYERYADSKAGLFHLGQTFGPNFSKEFFALAKPTRFVIYGTPTDEFKAAVADFHPVYMTPLDGFTR